MSYNWSELFGETLMKGDAEVKTSEVLADKEAVALYFSAHWCPPCRGFTPVFAEKYNKLVGEAGKKFECVFLSSDADNDAFKDYYKDMPWLALPYALRDKKEELATKFKCNGIPYLVILDGKTGETITTNGRAGISGGDFVADFPYHPKAVYDTSVCVDGVYEGKCFFLVQNYVDEAGIKANSEIFTKFATDNKAAAHKFFTINTNEGPTSFIRKQFGLKDPFQKPDIALVKMPDTSTAYEEMFGSKEQALNWGCDLCGKAGRDAKEQYHNKEKGYDMCEECYVKPSEELSDEMKVPVLRLLDLSSEQYYAAASNDVTVENMMAFLNDVKEGKLKAISCGKQE